MYQDSKRTCTAIVLLIKPFVWCRFRSRRRHGLLKLPNIFKSDLAIQSEYDRTPKQGSRRTRLQQARQRVLAYFGQR